MTTTQTLINIVKGNQMAVQAGKGNLGAVGKLFVQLLAQDRGQQQVMIGSCSGSTSSISVTIQSNWTPDAVVLLARNGSGLWVGHGQIGDGDAFYLRGNASVPQSMGVLGSQGIYLQSNGFSIGSKITNAAAGSYGYIAFRGSPTQS